MTQNSSITQSDIPQISLNQTSQILTNATILDVNSQVIPTNTLSETQIINIPQTTQPISQINVVSKNLDNIRDNTRDVNNIEDNNLYNATKEPQQNIEKLKEIKKDIKVAESPPQNVETTEEDSDSLTEESKEKLTKIFIIILYIIFIPIILFIVVVFCISCKCDDLLDCFEGGKIFDCDCCKKCCKKCDKCCWRCLGKLCFCFEKKKKKNNV